jgi:hypothetical protein
MISYLPLSDKLECIDLIVQATCMKSLVLENMAPLVKLWVYSVEKQIFGESVRHLSLFNLDITNKADGFLLPLLLPNIKELVCSEESKYKTMVLDNKIDGFL